MKPDTVHQGKGGRSQGQIICTRMGVKGLLTDEMVRICGCEAAYCTVLHLMAHCTVQPDQASLGHKPEASIPEAEHVGRALSHYWPCLDLITGPTHGHACSAGCQSVLCPRPWTELT